MLEETLSHFEIAFELGYIPDTLHDELETEGEEIEKMLNGYIAFLKRSKQGANEPGASHTIREDTPPHETGGLEDLPRAGDTDLQSSNL